jgi:hypothetical protein
MVGGGIATDQLNSLNEKKKAITNIFQQMPGMGQGRQQFEATLQQIFGPQARMFDANGTPSMEAIQLAGHLAEKATGTIQNIGQNYFGNSDYLLNPDNWNKISSPMGALTQVIGNNIPASFGQFLS